MKVYTTFPTCGEFERAAACLDGLRLSYDLIRPEPAYRHVGAPAVVMEHEARIELARAGDVACSGWVECRTPLGAVPAQEPPAYAEDIFGRASVMVLASCTADVRKIRVIAHISGDVSAAFPYLNAEMEAACYNAAGPTFTYMDGYRMVSAYAQRIAAAKADDIVDAWRVLEEFRRGVNGVWARRGDIEPSYVMRRKPPALEIYKRLPQTNCGACGELTCLALAVKVHGGQLSPRLCAPVFDGERADLRDALTEICSGLGISL